MPRYWKDLSSTERLAARTYWRLLGRLIEEGAEAAEADARFDGGEFSGPAHARMIEAKAHAIHATIAKHFNLPPRSIPALVVALEEQHLAAWEGR